MKSLHQVIIIALGIILGFGYTSGMLFKISHFTDEKVLNLSYCWPLGVYLVALVFVGLFRLMTATGESENGTVKAATEKTGEA